MFRRLLLFVTAATLAVPTLSGCATRTQADRHRYLLDATPVSESIWPERDGPHEVARLETKGDDLRFRAPYWDENGRLYIVDRLSRKKGEPRTLVHVSGRATPGLSAKSGPTLRFISSTDESSEASLTLQPRQSASIVYVAPPLEKKARGWVVYLCGVDGLRGPDERLLTALRKRGWAAVAVTASTDIYVRRLVAALADRLEDDSNASIARMIDEHLADRVYAAQAGLNYARLAYPTIPRDRVAVVGVSAGAIAAPAVAARLGDSIDAAVLIGGGAPFYRIMRESPVGRARFDVRIAEADGEPDENGAVEYRNRAPSAAEHRLLERQAVRNAQLDPYHLAPQLRRIPTLQLHAQFDAIVPASTGRTLYERLGKPEQWSYPVGHLGLMVMINLEADRIAKWVTRATK
ncbi:MAG: hypothetical protein ACF8PN_05620 [Phycisphaerales bacterium]